MRLLIVEDDEKTSGALQTGLENEGFSTATASTGEDGFFRLNSEKFDLVVLDWMLPGRDGVEILKTLRTRGTKTPVLLLTARDAADSGVHLAKANRFSAVTVGAGYTYSTATENFANPTPQMDYLNFSVSFDLPLWNRNKGAIDTARFIVAQAQKQLESAELKTEVQVRETFTTYQLMQERVQKFQGELLKGADDVLAAKHFSYAHGNSTLDDLLMAQSADNDVHQAYNNALADAANALLELERAAGLADFYF